MPTKRSPIGDWIHAHELDHDGVRVFVDAATPMPPSRGRRRLSLLGDGTFRDHRSGPDDRLVGSDGAYEFDGAHVTLRYAEAGRSPLTLKASLGAGQRKLETVRRESN